MIDPLLALARDAAFLGWSRMGLWASKLSRAHVEAKDDPNNLVTAADAEIEGLVRGYFARFRPQDVIVGEESAAPLNAHEVEDGSALLSGLVVPTLAEDPQFAARLREIEPLEWHVDPIDGTVNFVRRLPAHCISLGARHPDDRHPAEGQWEIGFVAAPVLNTVWYARPGAGAWVRTGLPEAEELTIGASATRISGTPAGLPGAVAATGFGYAPQRRAEQVSRLSPVLQEFDDVRRMGSAAIDVCLAAEGKVNAYFERGLGVYDWAGGAVIAREAGLYVQLPTERSEPVIIADTVERLEFLRQHA